MLITDGEIGTTHKFEVTPKRVVSLVPSLTETLCHFGLEDLIVGITKFCVHPKGLKETKTIVGGTKKVNFEKIKALSPDLIICNKEENTLEMVLELERIAPVWITDISTLDQSSRFILDVGTVFQKREDAFNFELKITEARSKFNEFASKISEIRVLYLIWKNPLMAAGNNTFIGEMLKLNKFINVAGDSRYPEVDIKSVWQPELILLSSEPYPFSQKEADELKLDFPNAKIILVDGEMFSWYGSRTLKAFDYFRTLHQ